MICERLAAGESLKGICKTEGMPPDSTVRLWVIDDVNGFAAQYARSRDAALDIMADDVLDIADDAGNDWMERNDPDNPGYQFNGEAVARARIRFDARRWYLSKLAPKRYGDRVIHAGDAENPLTMRVELAAADALKDAIRGGK